MTITFLGTGSSQGIPVVTCGCPTCHSSEAKDRRLRSSIHIATQGISLLIDAGPDLRQQALSWGVDRIDALLFTHEHRDHTGGLNELKSFVFKQKKSIPIYASPHVLACLQQEFSYLFAGSSYAALPNFELHPIENSPLNIAGLTVVPIRVYHDHLPIWGFKVGAFTYITDAKVIPEEEIAKIRGSAVLVVNALQKQPHPAHFSLKEAIALAQQVGAKVTYLTHIGHRLGLHQAIASELPSGIHLAYDGLQISI